MFLVEAAQILNAHHTDGIVGILRSIAPFQVLVEDGGQDLFVAHARSV